MEILSAIITFDLNKAEGKLYPKISNELEKIGIKKYFISNICETQLPNNTYFYKGEHQNLEALKIYLRTKLSEIFKKYNIGAKYCLFIAKP